MNHSNKYNNMEKNKKMKMIGAICLGLSSLMIVGQYIVRHYDNQDRKRPWDKEAYTVVLKHCYDPYGNSKKKQEVKKICSCYLDKIEANHSFYEYTYYVKLKERNEYLDSCRIAITNEFD